MFMLMTQTPLQVAQRFSQGSVSTNSHQYGVLVGYYRFYFSGGGGGGGGGRNNNVGERGGRAVFSDSHYRFMTINALNGSQPHSPAGSAGGAAASPTGNPGNTASNGGDAGLRTGSGLIVYASGGVGGAGGFSGSSHNQNALASIYPFETDIGKGGDGGNGGISPTAGGNGNPGRTYVKKYA